MSELSLFSDTGGLRWKLLWLSAVLSWVNQKPFNSLAVMLKTLRPGSVKNCRLFLTNHIRTQPTFRYELESFTCNGFYWTWEMRLPSRAVFKWLSKVITWFRLLRLVIGLKDTRQFFNQWESKQKPIAPCTRDFSRASSELQVIARNCDWFIALFVVVVIGRSNCFGFDFSTVVWKPHL